MTTDRANEIIMELGITNNETLDSLVDKIDEAVNEGKISRSEGDSFFEMISTSRNLANQEEIERLTSENVKLQSAKNENILRKEELIKQGANLDNLAGFDEAIRQIDAQIEANMTQIESLKNNKNNDVIRNTPDSSEIDHPENISDEETLNTVDPETYSMPDFEANEQRRREIEKLRRNKDASTNFVPVKSDLVKKANEAVSNLKDMAKSYAQTESNYAKLRHDIIREKNEKVKFNDQLIEDAKVNMENEIENIRRNPNLTEEEKESLISERQKEASDAIEDLSTYTDMTDKELDDSINKEFEAIDDAIAKDKKAQIKVMTHYMKLRVDLIGRYYSKGSSAKEAYEALKVLAQIELEDKELQRILRVAFDEALMRNKEMHKIYISYSEKASYDEQVKNDSIDDLTGVDLIDEYLNQAEKNYDRNALDKACDLINKMPEGDEKNDLQARAAEIDQKIKEHEKNSTIDDKDENLEVPETPVIIENAPKKTWKTWAMLAAGIGVGAAVFFTCGTVGVSILAISGGIAKRLITKRRKKLEAQRLSGELPVEEVTEPEPGIKGKIEQLKKYFKSEEFCRDATWFLNGAIYTGLGLNVASSIYNLAQAKLGAADSVTTTIKSHGDPTIPEPSQVTPTKVVQDPTSGIKIGGNVGDYNVSVGHDTASWATGGTHTENLISKYVNGDSIFKSFRVVNPDGSLGQAINTNGLSITDFCNQTGVDPSQIAVDVANKNGASQAWVSVEELLKGVGGKSL